MQFIETKALSKEDGLFLKALSGKLDRETVENVMEDLKDEKEIDIGAFIDAFYKGNREIFEEIRMEKQETFKDFIERTGMAAEWEARGEAKGKAEGIAEGEAKGKIKVARNLLKEGLSPDLVQRTTGIDPDTIKSLIR
jgi:predicted transposase/invertase (TIGR01784 family)